MAMTPVDAEHFILSHTKLSRGDLVPEIELHLASGMTPIWEATEDWLTQRNVAPPFWAFAWPGGQALARHFLDHPTLVARRRVLDFGAGSGIGSIACARSGAVVEAAEIDLLAVCAIRLNAVANEVSVMVGTQDIVGAPCRWDVVICGDICYEAGMAAHVLPWLRGLAVVSEVWIAYPGRAYLPRGGLVPVAAYRVPTSLELEDRHEREVILYRVSP